MRKLKTLAAILLTLALLVSLVGCSGGSGSSGSSSNPSKAENTTETSGSTSEETSEPTSSGATLQLIMPSNVQDFPEGVTEDNNFIVDYWSEKTGFKFDIVVLPNSNAEEKLNLMFNGGEVTGLVFEKDLTAPSRFFNQGVLQPFDDYMDGSFFFETYKDYQSKGVIDGHQYAAMIVPDGIPCSSSLYVVRKDILNGIGITEQPADFDAFVEMLRTIKEKTDLIPLGVYDAPSNSSWDTIAALFGVAPTHNQWAVRDGNVVYRFTQKEGYDYLTFCKQLYDEGLIPQDTLSLTFDSLTQLYLGGQVATLVQDSCWELPNLMPASEEKGYDSRFMDYPTGYYGQVSTGSQDRFFSQAIFLSSLAKNPADYVKMLDFLALPETIEVNNYGIEGEHFTLDDGGNRVLTEAGENLQWAVYYRNIFPPEEWYPVYGINANWAEYYYPSERHSVGATDFDPVEFMPQKAEDVTKTDELKETIIDQFYAKALTGEVELTEETFNAMVEDWLASGGQQIQDNYTEQYKAMGSPDFSGSYISYLPAEHPEYTGKYLWEGHE